MMRAFYRPRTLPASHDLSKPPPITLIAGPTASGKSALALAVADLITGQVDGLSADLVGWAMAARASAEAFEHADAVNGQRFGPR